MLRWRRPGHSRRGRCCRACVHSRRLHLYGPAGVEPAPRLSPRCRSGRGCVGWHPPHRRGHCCRARRRRQAPSVHALGTGRAVRRRPAVAGARCGQLGAAAGTLAAGGDRHRPRNGGSAGAGSPPPLPRPLDSAPARLRHLPRPPVEHTTAGDRGRLPPRPPPRPAGRAGGRGAHPAAAVHRAEAAGVVRHRKVSHPRRRLGLAHRDGLPPHGASPSPLLLRTLLWPAHISHRGRGHWPWCRPSRCRTLGRGWRPAPPGASTSPPRSSGTRRRRRSRPWRWRHWAGCAWRPSG